MKRKALLVVLSVVVVVLAGVIVAAAQGPRPAGPASSGELAGVQATLAAGTGFTYQGQLKSTGTAVNVTCDFIFKLLDAPVAGIQIGSNFSATVPITNGLFTTVLDFGAGAFTGDARWLDTQVRCPAGAGVYTPLTPRQALTPAPLALALPGLWTEQNATSPNLIGGFSGNVISPSVIGANIGGGGAGGNINRIASPGDYATIGGGVNNTAASFGATVGGGERNTVSVIDASIGGGLNNRASGIAATVPGGVSNIASGDYSLAAGNQAEANHRGTFVWADSTNAPFTSTATNQFLIRASGGVGINTDAPLANTLTVNGQIIGGGAATPPGTEPFNAEGASSGYSMDDRSAGVFPRWVIYPTAGELAFYNSSMANVVGVSTGGVLSALGGFNGQCLSGGTFNTAASGACNMDVAEAFASIDRTEPGDVVALVTRPGGGPSPAAGPTVRKAGRSEGALVVGVVSSNPGLVFDNGRTRLAGDNSQLITADRTVVALVGRVPVKVSLENGPIAVGDPLTGASSAGYAMKATQAGQILGYALQSSDELSEGKLLAWLLPGLYVPPAQLERLNANSAEPDSAALAAQVAQVQLQNTALQQQNAALAARVAALEQAHPVDGGVPTAWLLSGSAIVAGVVALRRRA